MGQGRSKIRKQDPIVAGVSIDDAGMLYVKVPMVNAVYFAATYAWNQAPLTCGSKVISDVLGCFYAVAEVACSHHVIVNRCHRFPA